jgi:hypothetical protein
LGPHGKPLYTTSHSRSEGGTAQSNASETGINLPETNLDTARLAMRNQLDEKGMKIDVMPKTLVIPINLEKTASEIVNSSGRQGTADNDENFHKGKYSIIDWIYLTSTTAWYLIDPEVHELNWFWRKRPTFKQDELFDTEVAVYKSTMRFSRGWSDWRGVWGSKGDGAAFSD